MDATEYEWQNQQLWFYHMLQEHKKKNPRKQPKTISSCVFKSIISSKWSQAMHFFDLGESQGSQLAWYSFY